MRLLPKNAKEKFDEAVCCTATTTSMIFGSTECSIGTTLPHVETYKPYNYSNEWRCKHCESLNPNSVYDCHTCGAPKK